MLSFLLSSVIALVPPSIWEFLESVYIPLASIDLPNFYFFDEFQFKLYKLLVFIILTNCLLIWLSWHVFGDKIVEKFLQPSSTRQIMLIEELQKSISELKMPNFPEHSPRI